jgi:aspartate kinase
MIVFKFGGASVKDASSVRNMASILSGHCEEEMIVVVSAMSKTTNKLEQLTAAWHRDDRKMVESHTEEIKRYHFGVMHELLPVNSSVFSALSDLFNALWETLQGSPPDEYDKAYELVVPFGELLSSVLIFHYLKHTGLNPDWLDARKLIITDETWREGRIDWELTTANLQRCIETRRTSGASMAITQGFIGSTRNGEMITLGREGSDFTAAVIAYALEAEEVIIWKDVPGLMNADPALFPDAVMLPELSFHEAIELAYYGAKVIHPKTIKPLQNKDIPLRVKSFLDPEAPGSLIHNLKTYGQDIPSYIIKEQQALISFSPKDFSFIAEKNISEIFSVLSSLNLRANLMQNSAISFSICIDDHESRINQIMEALQEQFSVRYNKNLTMITIRHFTEEIIDGLIANAKVILEQRSRNTVQLVISDK